MKRGKIYHSIEKCIDLLIFPAVLVLLVVIIIELFFHDIADTYHTAIVITDYTVISIFAIDLVFKYFRIKNFNTFLRKSWLDIIAIFPFFLVFRIFEPLIFLTDFSKEAKNVQLIFHESLELSKSGSKIVREVEAAGKVSRARTITALFRAAGRAPRFLKAVAFYEQPLGKHHLEKVPGKKEYKKIKKELGIKKKRSKKK